MSQAVVIIDATTADLNDVSDLKWLHPKVKVILPSCRKTIPMPLILLAMDLKGDLEFIRIQSATPKIADKHFIFLLGAVVGDTNGSGVYVISCRKALARLIVKQGLYTRLSASVSKMCQLESFPLKSPLSFGLKQSSIANVTAPFSRDQYGSIGAL